ncbi:MAG: hypothetical protein KJP21_01125 [Bacteroidia bacterium]|nr:hypothetical protein [Bacteroidia bacterium]NNJ55014.1 hypothetical protein [Bacteroidia bacterium]
MKQILVAFLTLIFIGSFISAEAQTLSKSEKKALKKEIKTYKKDPEKWVRMMNKQKSTVKGLEDEIDALKLQLKEAKDKNKELQTKMSILNDKYTNLLNTMPSTKLPMGTVYQVQMGYYQYLDLVSFNNKLKVVKAEEIDGAKRYVIGHFDDLMDAVQFSNDIKALGISDAFVSQYIDGNRNMDFDALEVISR